MIAKAHTSSSSRKLEKKMRQRLARSIIPTWLLFVAILISGAHYNVTQAQDNPKSKRTAAALACGKEIKKQCSGVPVGVPVGRASASKQRSRVFPEEPGKTFREMRCIGEQCCAHVR